MPVIITLTTDFGARDPYAGVMKGVILGIAPEARIVDITHEVPPFDTEAATFAVLQALPYFPPDTIHLVVVDPEVGTRRRALAAAGRRARFVGPDNGVLAPLLDADGPARVFDISRSPLLPEARSSTFHGRDVFAPAAAHLAAGISLERLGQPIDTPAAARTSGPERRDDGWHGRVVHVDRFGNLITNLDTRHAVELSALRVEGMTLPLANAYADIAKGTVGALLGSAGHIEVFLREGSAANALRAGIGTPVLGVIA